MRSTDWRRVRATWPALFTNRKVCSGLEHRCTITCRNFPHAGIALHAVRWLGSIYLGSHFHGLGYIFSDQLEQIATYALRWGGWLLLVLAGSLAIYILWRYLQRQRFLHRLRIARIKPKDLMEKLAAGDEVMIVDLRQPLDVETIPYMIPGAVHMAVEELEKRHQEIPRDRDIVLYCS